MKIDIIDAVPILKEIEEESGEYKRLVLKDKRRAVNANIKVIRDALFKLLEAVYFYHHLTVSDNQVDRIINQETREFTTSQLSSITIHSNDEKEKTLNEDKTSEIWSVIILFLSGICTEPDSDDYPALPADAPNIDPELKKIVLELQRAFIVDKAKATTKPTKVSRPVSVRFGDNRIKIAGLWVETVLSKPVRLKIPRFIAQVTGFTISIKKQISFEIGNKLILNVDILTDNDVLPFMLGIFQYKQFYFQIDELYTSSNDSSTFELKSMADIFGDS